MMERERPRLSGSRAPPPALVDAVMAHAESAWPATLDRLAALVRIPSCSFPGFDPTHVVASATSTAAWFREAGFPEVQVLPGGGIHPAVIACDRRAGPDRPTLLLYAHHDVQPPLREQLWRTPPHEPVIRDGRMWGRGTADDKAGIMCHCAAAAAWNAVAGAPPINLVAVIEGEEEVGSPHFPAFLKQHLDRLRADAVLVMDAGNYATGLPSITTSLRGHLVVEVELAGLQAPLHSGLWGGAVPDPAAALARLLATLTDEHGAIAVPALLQGVRPLSDADRADFARLPYTPAWFAGVAGLLDPSLAPGDAVEAHARLWRQPTLAINAMQCGERGRTGNVIMDSAWARLGLRLVPDQDPVVLMRALCDHLRAHAPAGLRLTLTEREPGPAWGTDTAHPVFAAARAALRRGFGVEPVAIGCGASIPFVGEMTALLGGVPALLLGVEDPQCGAHAENEGLLLADAHSALRSEIALFALLADVAPASAGPVGGL
jgi:acetylornithine deacetylase/succinyl-diaminopimelate desuccinylase-like protein